MKRMIRCLVGLMVLLVVPAVARAGCPTPVPTGSGTCASPFVVPDACLYTPGPTNRDMTIKLTGTTVGASSLNAGSCDHSTTPSPEIVYKWTAPVTGKGILTTCGGQTKFDTVLYAREGDCTTGNEVACNDDASSKVYGPTAPRTVVEKCSRMEFPVWQGDDYYAFVDGADGEAGPYKLSVRFIVGVNGVYAMPTTTTSTAPPTTTTAP